MSSWEDVGYITHNHMSRGEARIPIPTLGSSSGQGLSLFTQPHPIGTIYGHHKPISGAIPPLLPIRMFTEAVKERAPNYQLARAKLLERQTWHGTFPDTCVFKGYHI